jgi:hypothetical protein
MFDAAIDGGREGTMTVTMEPAFDVRSFRRALGHFPTGVCVVTSQVDGARVGMTVSSFNSLSLEPPLILFSIDGRTTGLSLRWKAKGYAVNMLAENQKGSVGPFRQVRLQQMGRDHLRRRIVRRAAAAWNRCCA